MHVYKMYRMALCEGLWRMHVPLLYRHTSVATAGSRHQRKQPCFWNAEQKGYSLIGQKPRAHKTWHYARYRLDMTVRPRTNPRASGCMLLWQKACWLHHILTYGCRDGFGQVSSLI